MTKIAHRSGTKAKLITAKVFTCLAVLGLAGGLSATATAATLPTGFHVAAGNGNVSAPATEGNAMIVTQHSERAIIDWKTFNIGKNNAVMFNQPDSKALAVNRVTSGSKSPTRILGTLRSNGNIMILDPNGVLFSRTAHINVGGIIASTGTLANPADVMDNSKSAIALVNIDKGRVINESSSFTVANGGLLAFVAPTAENTGIITANVARISLAAGKAVTVDLTGDNLIDLQVSKNTELAKALVKNSGTIADHGGTVTMTARVAAGVVNNVVNMSGVIAAGTAYTDKAGHIVLNAGTAGVRVSGDLWNKNVRYGNTIDISGRTVDITHSAKLDTRGDTFENKGGAITISANKALRFDGLALAGGRVGGSITLDSKGYLRTNDRLDTRGWEDSEDGRNVNGKISLAAARMVLGGDRNAADRLSGRTLASLMTKTGTLAITGTDGVTVRGAEGGLDVSRYGEEGYTFADLALSGSSITFDTDFATGIGGLSLDTPTLNLYGRLLGMTKSDGESYQTLLSGDRLAADGLQTVNLDTNASIPQALYVANAGDTVNFRPGFYDTSTVEVNKSLILNGRPNGHGRAYIMVDGYGFDAHAKNVTIDGFRIWSTNTGIHVSAKNATITDNIIAVGRGDSSYNTGIYVDHSGTVNVSGNSVLNYMIGISVNNTDTAQIDNNTVAGNPRDGIVAFGDGGFSSGIVASNIGTADLSGNTVQYHFMGLSLALSDHGHISDNTISRNFLGLVAGENANVSITDNTIKDNLINAFLLDNRNAFFANNDIKTTLRRGRIDMIGLIGLIDYAPNPEDYLSLTGNTFSNNLVGAVIAGGTLDLRGPADTFIGGVTGLLVSTNWHNPALDTVFAGNTLGRTVFIGQSKDYVDLSSMDILPLGAFVPFFGGDLAPRHEDAAAPTGPAIIDGTHATFDGVSAGGFPMPLRKVRAVKSKILDYNDNKLLDLIVVAPNGHINNNRVHSDVNLFHFRPGVGSVTITGRHRNRGFTPNDLANITPAAGGDDRDRARHSACGFGLANGGSVSFSLKGTLNSLFAHGLGCGI